MKTERRKSGVGSIDLVEGRRLARIAHAEATKRRGLISHRIEETEQ